MGDGRYRSEADVYEPSHLTCSVENDPHQALRACPPPRGSVPATKMRLRRSVFRHAGGRSPHHRPAHAACPSGAWIICSDTGLRSLTDRTVPHGHDDFGDRESN
jgi:hypothetical protein